MYTECIQPVYEMDTQVRLGKDRLGKDSIDNKKEKGVTLCNATDRYEVTQGNGTEEEREEDKEIDIEKDNNSISKDILVSSNIDTLIKLLIIHIVFLNALIGSLSISIFKR